MNNDSFLNQTQDPSNYYSGKTSSLDEIHLRDYFRVVMHRKWVIVAIFTITVLLVTLYTFKQKPIFQAVTTIRIFKEAPKVLSFEEVMSTEGGRTDFYKTECEVLKSLTLAKRVVDSLRLDLDPEFIGNSKALDGSVNKSVSMDRLARQLLGRTEILSVRNSQLVKIKVSTGYPELCKKIADTIADEYIKKNLEDKVLTTSGATDEIVEQLKEIKIKIEDSEKKLYKYARENDIVAMDASQSIILKELTTISDELTRAEAERIGKEIRFLAVQNSDDLSSLPGIADNKLINELKLEYTRLNAKYASELGRVKEDHPLVQRLKTEKSLIEQEIKDEQGWLGKAIKAEYQEAVGKEKGLRQHLEELKRENNRLEGKSISYKVLKREVDANTQLYEGLLQRMKQATVSSQIKTTNVQIVDRAALPTRPVKPKKRLNVFLSMVVGLVMGTGIAFFLEYLDNTIKSADDVEKHLNATVLGVLEKVEVERDEVENFDTILHELPKSTFAEAVRNVRTGIMLSSADNPKRIMLVTSTTPSEGKTFVASNLAIVIAKTGKKTLIVDCDFRKPRVHKAFNIQMMPGLTNHILGDNDLDSIIKHTAIPNISVITCGLIPPNPSEMLGSHSMEKFCKEIMDRFDTVILDTPPAMAVTDTIVLSNMVDGIIYVIKSGKISKESARRSLHQFAGKKAEVLGVVINSVDAARGDFYGYGYGYGYGVEEKGKKGIIERMKWTKGKEKVENT
ncbi:ATPases [Candidatus Scalindua japonica]|uniref:non-specific protein-tyrosine kinase n=1 Tax=Candidatus Scalindua japonica TaxID=1284222 RepID=A0A286U4B3_9BACT|nr:polysaccharide biosynthesis tyrosine autokinase [Candidatus Scalindua japonica]GAX62901.1 ATPases [Candidatus Scalindua japonica]